MTSRTWHQVVPVAMLPAKGCEGLAVQAGGERLALFLQDDGTVLAVENECPHRGMALHTGYLERGRLFCAEHHWSWPLPGTASDGLQHSALRAYPTDVRDGWVWVDLGGGFRLGD